MDFEVGHLVGGKYRIVRRIGVGGMGSVYEARHAGLGTPVAIKVLLPQLAKVPTVADRFRREAQVSATLKHPHVIQVTDVDQLPDGRPYLVMELLKGQTLQDYLDQHKSLSREEAVDIGLQILLGLECAHGLGVVHRDLKPGNVFLDEQGVGRVAKLLDFGIAKYAASGDSTDECSLLGTVGYMAPEQVVSSKRVNHRADIYSLGLVLFEAINGTPAYSGDRTEVLYEIVHGRSISVDDFDRDLPRSLARAIVRATARDPLARYASVRELAVAIAPFAGHGFLRSESEYSSARGALGSRAPGKAAAAQLANTQSDGSSAPRSHVAHGWMAPGQVRRSALLTIGALVTVIASGTAVAIRASSARHMQTAYALPVAMAAPAEQTTPTRSSEPLEASHSLKPNDNGAVDDRHVASGSAQPLRIRDDASSHTTEHRARGDMIGPSHDRSSSRTRFLPATPSDPTLADVRRAIQPGAVFASDNPYDAR